MSLAASASMPSSSLRLMEMPCDKSPAATDLRNGTSDMIGRENCVAQYRDPAAASVPSTIDSATIVHSSLDNGANATSVRINRIVRQASGRYGRFSVVAYAARYVESRTSTSPLPAGALM